MLCPCGEYILVSQLFHIYNPYVLLPIIFRLRHHCGKERQVGDPVSGQVILLHPGFKEEGKYMNGCSVPILR